jgi:hypothetical protein
MPKAGRYEYPVYDVDLVLDKLRKFHETLREDESTRSVLAETLGMSEKGGGFAHLVAAMEKYGLVETGEGKVVLTELGKTCLYGEGSERDAARAKAVTGVELFREIHALYGAEAKEDQIRALLRQKAQLDPAEAQLTAPEVYKVYRKVGTYVREEGYAERRGETPMSFAPSKHQPNPTNSQALRIQYGDVYIQVPPDDDQAISLAIEALQFMRERRKAGIKQGP